MARTTTTKKTKLKPAKPKQNMQTAMPKGKYGKFEVVNKNTLSLHTSNKPVDKMLMKEKMTQSMGKCAAAYTWQGTCLSQLDTDMLPVLFVYIQNANMN